MFCILNKQTQILITFQNFTMSSELLIHRAPEFQTEHANECKKKHGANGECVCQKVAESVSWDDNTMITKQRRVQPNKAPRLSINGWLRVVVEV